MSWRRYLPLSLALLLGPAGVSVIDASAETVPPSWTRYAMHISMELQERLADRHDGAAARLHAWLDAQAAGSDEEPPAPILRLWLDRRGAVSRVSFATLGDAQADRDLRHVVVEGGPFGAPPDGMRQPLILRLKLTYPS